MAAMSEVPFRSTRQYSRESKAEFTRQVLVAGQVSIRTFESMKFAKAFSRVTIFKKKIDYFKIHC